MEQERNSERDGKGFMAGTGNGEEGVNERKRRGKGKVQWKGKERGG